MLCSGREGVFPIDPFRSAGSSGPAARRRWPWAAAGVLLSAALLIPAAGSAQPEPAAPAGRVLPATGPPGDLARLEARAAKLAREYRGQLGLLSQAESAARATTATMLRLHRRLGRANTQLARLAAASYMGGVQDPAVVILGGVSGDPERMLRASATFEYVTRQRSGRERALKQFLLAEQRAERAASARTAALRGLLAKLAGQRHRVEALLARFRPESPVIGDTITARMRQVKNEVDRRFGPFSSIGCYRAEASGEHPLGRACDFMLSTGGVMPAGASVRRGYDIAAWAQANASRLGIMYIIYRQRIWDIRMPSAGWVQMADRGSITANHYDHVHISVF
jgi:hypothetical protein